MLEELLSGPELAPRLARHYFDASARGAVPGERMRLLRRAAEVLAGDQTAGDLAIEVEQQLFALDPEGKS